MTAYRSIYYIRPSHSQPTYTPPGHSCCGRGSVLLPYLLRFALSFCLEVCPQRIHFLTNALQSKEQLENWPETKGQTDHQLVIAAMAIDSNSHVHMKDRGHPSEANQMDCANIFMCMSCMMCRFRILHGDNSIYFVSIPTLPVFSMKASWSVLALDLASAASVVLTFKSSRSCAALALLSANAFSSSTCLNIDGVRKRSSILAPGSATENRWT
jgi:hypothetical protein